MESPQPAPAPTGDRRRQPLPAGIDRRRAADRRGAERIPFIASVREQIGQQVHLALAQNLGERGMKLWRPRGLARYSTNTPVELCFALPDEDELVYASGVIVFERAEGAYQSTGIRF